MNPEFLHLPFEIKAVDDDGAIEGYGAVFGNVDLGYDRIERGAFKESLAARKRGELLPILWQHNADEPIGVWTEAFEDKRGLYVTGQLQLSRDSGQADVPTAYKARALAKAGAVKGLSIGFYAEDYRYEGDIRVLTKISVREVSMATFPMNPKAQLASVKNWTNKTCVQDLRDCFGMSRNEAEAFRAGGLKALREYVDDDRQPDDVAEGMQHLLNRIKGATA